MSALKHLAFGWLLTGAWFAYSLREEWVQRMREERPPGKALTFAVVFFVSMMVAPAAWVIFFVCRKIRVKG